MSHEPGGAGPPGPGGDMPPCRGEPAPAPPPPEAARQGAAPPARGQDGGPPGGPHSHRHEVHIYEHAGTPKIDDDTRAALANSGMLPDGRINIKGVSAKMLRRMRREYVDCPVLGRDMQFLTCFVCPNFLSRVRGKVLCIGNPIEPPRPPQG